VVLAIFIPFTIETYKYYQYNKLNAPEGYAWPGFEAFWLTGVTVVITMIMERTIESAFYPIFLNLCKE
jgi:hypothetical protein